RPGLLKQRRGGIRHFMRVGLRLDPNRLRRWHLHLLERLDRRPQIQVAVEWAVAGDDLPSAVSVLFALERLIHRLPPDGIAANAEAGDFSPYVSEEESGADLVLDFAGGDPRPGERCWHITFDGVRGEAAALGAL